MTQIDYKKNNTANEKEIDTAQVSKWNEKKLRICINQ